VTKLELLKISKVWPDLVEVNRSIFLGVTEVEELWSGSTWSW
jgi:hypothetical protein